MCQEVFEIAKTMNLKELKTQLALQCAPVLTGVKISNLLIVGKGKEAMLWNIFEGTDLCVCKICERKERDTYLIYRKAELFTYLMKKEVALQMKLFGYELDNEEKLLLQFAARYQAHLDAGTAFPHEMGLLLGYPKEDVMGFIECHGKNYRYSGYWKVYGDVKEAKEKFRTYDKAKEQLICMVAEGMDISDILKHCIREQFAS